MGIPLEPGGEGADQGPPCRTVSRLRHHQPEEEDPNPADWEEEDDQPRASDEEARRLNDKVKDEMADAMKGVTVQNVTMAEVMESRSAREVIRAISLIFVKYPQPGHPAVSHALRSGEGVPGEAGAAVVFRAQPAAHHDGGR